MPNSISTTSNTQTTTNSRPANQAINGAHDDGLSMAQIITLAMIGYGKEGSQ